MGVSFGSHFGSRQRYIKRIGTLRIVGSNDSEFGATASNASMRTAPLMQRPRRLVRFAPAETSGMTRKRDADIAHARQVAKRLDLRFGVHTMRVSFHVGGVTAVAFAATLALLGCGGSLDDEPMAREASAKAEPDVQPSNVASQSLEKTRAPDDVAEIRRELAALRKDVNDMQRRLDRTHAQSTDAARTAQALQPVQSEAERLARNESAFRIESADPTWSRNAELRIRTAVTQIGDGVPDRIRGLECRSKTCRVEIAPDDFQSVDEALPRITAQLGDTFASAESAHFDQGDGRIAGVLFLSR